MRTDYRDLKEINLIMSPEDFIELSKESILTKEITLNNHTINEIKIRINVLLEQ